MRSHVFLFLALLTLVFVTLVANLNCALAHDGHQHGAGDDFDKNRPLAMSDESVFQLDSSWIDQSGKKLALTAFRGNPSVLAMVYTSCRAACSIITSDMQRIEKALPPAALDQAHFVLVSFDPERDTPEQLKKFATNHGLDLKHWTLLTGSPNNVRDLAAVLGIKYRKDARGDFAHSNVITILDSEGLIRHQQVGLRQDPRASADVVSSVLKAAK